MSITAGTAARSAVHEGAQPYVSRRGVLWQLPRGRAVVNLATNRLVALAVVIVVMVIFSITTVECRDFANITASVDLAHPTSATQQYHIDDGALSRVVLANVTTANSSAFPSPPSVQGVFRCERRVDCRDARCNLFDYDTCTDTKRLRSQCACPLELSTFPSRRTDLELEPQWQPSSNPEQTCMVFATAVHHCRDGGMSPSHADQLDRIKRQLYTRTLQYWARSGYTLFVVDSTGFDWGRQAWWANHMHAYNFKQECPVVGSSSHAELTALVNLLHMAPDFANNCGYVVKLTPRYQCTLPSWPVGYELHLQNFWREQVEGYSRATSATSKVFFKPPIRPNATVGWQASELFVSKASITAELWTRLHKVVHEESLGMEGAMYRIRFSNGYNITTLPPIPLLEKVRLSPRQEYREGDEDHQFFLSEI